MVEHRRNERQMRELPGRKHLDSRQRHMSMTAHELRGVVQVPAVREFRGCGTTKRA
jgi:hypothetical protein